MGTRGPRAATTPSTRDGEQWPGPPQDTGAGPQHGSAGSDVARPQGSRVGTSDPQTGLAQWGGTPQGSGVGTLEPWPSVGTSDPGLAQHGDTGPLVWPSPAGRDPPRAVSGLGTPGLAWSSSGTSKVQPTPNCGTFQQPLARPRPIAGPSRVTPGSVGLSLSPSCVLAGHPPPQGDPRLPGAVTVPWLPFGVIPPRGAVGGVGPQTPRPRGHALCQAGWAQLACPGSPRPHCHQGGPQLSRALGGTQRTPLRPLSSPSRLWPGRCQGALVCCRE